MLPQHAAALVYRLCSQRQALGREARGRVLRALQADARVVRGVPRELRELAASWTTDELVAIMTRGRDGGADGGAGGVGGGGPTDDGDEGLVFTLDD